jgi:hypothetical protein
MVVLLTSRFLLGDHDILLALDFSSAVLMTW